MQTQTLRYLSLLLALGWAAVIYHLSSQPGTDEPMLFIHQDKALHLIAFGLLGFLAMGAVRAKGNTHRNWQVWLIVLLGLHHVLLEPLLELQPNRE